MKGQGDIRVVPTNGCDDGAGEEEGLAKGPGGDAGVVAKDLHPAVVGPHDLSHEVLQLALCITNNNQKISRNIRYLAAIHNTLHMEYEKAPRALPKMKAKRHSAPGKMLPFLLLIGR